MRTLPQLFAIWIALALAACSVARVIFAAGNGLTVTEYLKRSKTGASDQFGVSVAVSAGGATRPARETAVVITGRL